MTQTLRVAVSPCPNDTFIFGAWTLGCLPPLEAAPCAFIRRDVEELNALVESPAPRAKVVKISAAQAMVMGEEWSVLRSGAAFGFGAGPKLAARAGLDFELAPEFLRRLAIDSPAAITRDTTHPMYAARYVAQEAAIAEVTRIVLATLP